MDKVALACREGSADKVYLPMEETRLATFRQGPMNWQTALEHHDSAPEDQPQCRSGCDWDHIISPGRQLRSLVCRTRLHKKSNPFSSDRSS